MSEQTPKALPDLTPEQTEAVAANYLASLEPGALPFPTFIQIARLAVLNTLEVGFVKPFEEQGNTRVLLTQRPSTDKFWPNQWHIPGAVVLASDPVKHDHDYDAALGRVRDEAGGSLHMIGDPLEFDTVRRMGLRGSEITVRMLAETEGDPDKGEFFDARDVLKNPPKGGLVHSHEDAIAKIAAAHRSLSSRS